MNLKELISYGIRSLAAVTFRLQLRRKIVVESAKHLKITQVISILIRVYDQRK